MKRFNSAEQENDLSLSMIRFQTSSVVPPTSTLPINADAVFRPLRCGLRRPVSRVLPNPDLNLR
jgi:hypothetical protein